jgi:hypothetical protein
MNVALVAQFLPESYIRHFLPNFYPLSLFKTIGNPGLGLVFYALFPIGCSYMISDCGRRANFTSINLIFNVL